MAIYRIQRTFTDDQGSSGNTALAVGAGSLAAAGGARAYGVNQANKIGESIAKDLNSQGVSATFNKAGFFKKGGFTIDGVNMAQKGAENKLSAGTMEKMGDSFMKNQRASLKAGGAGLAAAGLGLAGIGALGYGLYKKSQNNN